MTDSPDTANRHGRSRETGEDTYRDLVEGLSSHALLMLDTDGRIVTWPEPAHTLYGYDPESVLDRPFEILLADQTHQEVDAEADPPDWGTVTKTEMEHWHRTADGAVFWASVTVSPLADREGHGYAVIIQDQTEDRQYEQMLERQNDRLMEFTDILAHDLRNPLNLIGGRLSLYRESGDVSHLDVIGETVDRMERLVDDLLRVARQGSVVTDPEPTDIHRVVDTAWEGAGPGSDGTLQYEEVGNVSSDPDRLCQLFENLFRNALEHAGPAVTVRVGPLKNGFFVEDDGPGIPADVRSDVFDHGMSTIDDGSGYGLSVVRTIANAHGWDAAVTASTGQGARFEITGIEFLE